MPGEHRQPGLGRGVAGRDLLLGGGHAEPQHRQLGDPQQDGDRHPGLAELEDVDVAFLAHADEAEAQDAGDGHRRERDPLARRRATMPAIEAWLPSVRRSIGARNRPPKPTMTSTMCRIRTILSRWIQLQPEPCGASWVPRRGLGSVLAGKVRARFARRGDRPPCRSAAHADQRRATHHRRLAHHLPAGGRGARPVHQRERVDPRHRRTGADPLPRGRLPGRLRRDGRRPTRPASSSGRGPTRCSRSPTPTAPPSGASALNELPAFVQVRGDRTVAAAGRGLGPGGVARRVGRDLAAAMQLVQAAHPRAAPTPRPTAAPTDDVA